MFNARVQGLLVRLQFCTFREDGTAVQGVADEERAPRCTVSVAFKAPSVYLS